ncbi:MAG: hypothetical protein D6693_07015 [Planctomycetota bacterium]|nr:MAG: hypothetical protein D6693_07015 [Planctomycetota bacterium]
MSALIEVPRFDHLVEILGGRRARARAARAGVAPSAGGRPSGPVFTLAWDDAGEGHRRRRGLPGWRVPGPIPPRPALIAGAEQAARTLRLRDGVRAAALLGRAGEDYEPGDPALLAGVLGMAGRPVVIVVLDGPGPSRRDRRALECVAPASGVVVADGPPWAVLAACRWALTLAPIGEASAPVEDDARWARSAGAPVIGPAPAGVRDERDSRRLRYLAARSLSRALASEPTAPPGPTLRDGAFDDWLRDLIDTIAADAGQDGSDWASASSSSSAGGAAPGAG